MKSFIRVLSGRAGLECRPDSELASALANGSHQALSVLIDRYAAAVYRSARQILLDHGEAEEVVQVVFLETFKNISKFDPERGSFRAWLLRRASSRTLDRLRQLKSQGFYKWLSTEEVDIATGINELLGMTDQETAHLIEELIAMLSPRQQQIMRLRYFRGLSLNEIQEETRETSPAVRHLLYDGIKAMRKALLDHAGDRPERRDRSGAPSRVF